MSVLQIHTPGGALTDSCNKQNPSCYTNLSRACDTLKGLGVLCKIFLLLFLINQGLKIVFRPWLVMLTGQYIVILAQLCLVSDWSDTHHTQI